MKPKPDATLRRRFFTEESFAHPAKLHIGLFQEILARYEIQAGSWLLDPMAGSGTCLLACLQGINVIANEMELHFIVPMLASWQKIQDHGPMLGYSMGSASIIRGDARALPLGKADVIVTSPPYEEAHQGGEEKHYDRMGRRPGGPLNGLISQRYTDVNAVVTSPPYADTADAKRHPGDQLESEKGHILGYTRRYTNGNCQNIGNLRNAAYWGSMSLVYQECHRVLCDGGVMVLVVKGCIRDKKYVDLPQQTIDMVETLGFKLVDRWERELWGLSFWRILQQRNNPEGFDERLRFEQVLGFRKEA